MSQQRDEDEPETQQVNESGDTESDPALDDEGTDWSSEGGAVPEGPATETD